MADGAEGWVKTVDHVGVRRGEPAVWAVAAERVGRGWPVGVGVGPDAGVRADPTRRASRKRTRPGRGYWLRSRLNQVKI